MDLTSQDSGLVKVLSLTGSFTNATAGPARQWLDDATAAAPAAVVVDLSGVRFMDSTALSTLVHGMKRARAVGGDLRLCGLQQPVRMIFEMTRLDRVFDIFNQSDEAIQAFSTNEQPATGQDEG